MSINPLNNISRVYLEKVASVDEAVKGADPEMRKAAAAERKTGDKPLPEKEGKAYSKFKASQISYIDKKTKGKHMPGYAYAEGLDPVGQEDSDIDNDGDTDKSDKYLHKRRKAIGKAIAKKTVKEGFSDWRQDLSEVMDDIEANKKIKEKKVQNKVTINPKLNEAVEQLGGTLLEMVEIDEMDFIVESVYDELLEEGYEEDDIEEAIEYALAEAKVTYGHDTKKPESGARRLIKTVGKIAREKLTSAVVKGARAVASGATKLADKAEGKPKPAAAHSTPGTRTAKTYRGAGAGRVEKVGSPAPKAAPKKAEKPSDPWEGSATTPQKPKAKKTTTKKPAAPKAKAPVAKPAPKRKRKSKLDDLLASVRSEEVQIDEKTLTKMEMKKREEIVKSMKDKAGDFEKRYPGRGKEVMYATATKMAKKIAEQTVDNPSTTVADPALEKKQQMLDKTKLANLKMLQQKKQQLDRQKLQMQKSGKLPLEAD